MSFKLILKTFICYNCVIKTFINVKRRNKMESIQATQTIPQVTVTDIHPPEETSCSLRSLLERIQRVALRIISGIGSFFGLKTNSKPPQTSNEEVESSEKPREYTSRNLDGLDGNEGSETTEEKILTLQRRLKEAESEKQEAEAELKEAQELHLKAEARDTESALINVELGEKLKEAELATKQTERKAAKLKAENKKLHQVNNVLKEELREAKLATKQTERKAAKLEADNKNLQAQKEHLEREIIRSEDYMGKQQLAVDWLGQRLVKAQDQLAENLLAVEQVEKKTHFPNFLNDLKKTIEESAIKSVEAFKVFS